MHRARQGHDAVYKCTVKDTAFISYKWELARELKQRDQLLLVTVTANQQSYESKAVVGNEAL